MKSKCLVFAQFWSKSNNSFFDWCKTVTHVLAHLLKSFWANNVKSSSTLFSNNIQWNFKISFSCVRLNNQLGYNLITENWDHQKWDFCQNGASENWRRRENSLSCVICCFEKHFIGYLQNIVCIKIAFNIYLNNTNFLNFVQSEINKILQ